MQTIIARALRKSETARSKCEAISLKERCELNASEEDDFVRVIESLIGGFLMLELRLQSLHRPSVPGIMDSLDAASLPSPGWSDEKNARRCALIDKEIAGALTDDERLELEQLQLQAIAYRDQVALPPIDGARKLHQRLLEKKRQNESKE